MIRPDVYFTPYFPAVFFATAFGGYRIGIATSILSGVLGVTVNFGGAPNDFAKMALLTIFMIVCGITIWGGTPREVMTPWSVFWRVGTR